jgi:c(7)-type cytochrome triheme protein
VGAAAPGLLARALLALAAIAGLAWSTPVPHEYGRVVIDNFSRRAGVPPVAFDHFRHRSQFTCRLCHVDIGFAMAAGETRVSATTNGQGFHCGACHNGKLLHLDKPVFAACDKAKRFDAAGSCGRCHAKNDPVKLRQDFQVATRNLPRDGFGGVDWERAEAEKLVRPVDFVEGASIPRKAIQMNREVQRDSAVGWMSNVIFSHRKHAVWNGCEVCHPEIFPSTKSGEVHYTMLQIAAGQYCGVCHDKVAFPIGDCDRCHKEKMAR